MLSNACIRPSPSCPLVHATENMVDNCILTAIHPDSRDHRQGVNKQTRGKAPVVHALTDVLDNGAVIAVLLCCVWCRQHLQPSHGADRVDRTVRYLLSTAHSQATAPQIQVGFAHTFTTCSMCHCHLEL